MRLTIAILLAALVLGSCSSHVTEYEAGPAALMLVRDSAAAGEEWRYRGPLDREEYDRIEENPFLDARRNPLSTFSVDVDTASYANVRRILTHGSRPPPDAVRIEELVNYFDYEYPAPEDDTPFRTIVEVAGCPWNDAHRLVHIGIQGRPIPDGEMPPRNLVFLLDVSGSMNHYDKLPLVKAAMKMLAERLTEKDRVAIVVYAGASGLVLPPTGGDEAEKILAALEELQAGGSTNGGEGIELAYRTARESLGEEGINRVILCTDGDFNVGVTNRGDLTRLIERERESGIFLTVLGFGRGNLRDSTMEQLADRGNGNYAYIDTAAEARKVLVEEAGGTLVTIAKDVKLQVEFNPARVGGYRLIGYENRLLKDEDFNDDLRDAGDIGAGHTVTALYEIVSPEVWKTMANVDPLRYQEPSELSAAAGTEELVNLKIRYKEPDGTESRLLITPVPDAADVPAALASREFRFSAAVAEFGLLLRESEHKGTASYAQVRKFAKGAMGDDPHGYRAEFLRLVALAEDLE